MKLVGIAAAGLLSLAGAAHAATLTSMQGQVLLNQGGGYKPVSGSVEVKAGDSILVNPDGLAQLAYGDCATYEIKPGDVVYVAEQSTIPCAAGVNAAGGIGANGLLIGGLAVAVGVGVIVGVSSGDDSPSSP
jgi:hypothetical protein